MIVVSAFNKVRTHSIPVVSIQSKLTNPLRKWKEIQFMFPWIDIYVWNGNQTELKRLPRELQLCGRRYFWIVVSRSSSSFCDCCCIQAPAGYCIRSWLQLMYLNYLQNDYKIHLCCISTAECFDFVATKHARRLIEFLGKRVNIDSLWVCFCLVIAKGKPPGRRHSV